MIVRRNGTLDVRVLATRLAWYAGAVSAAVLLGVGVGMLGS